MIRRIGESDGRRLIILGLDGASFNYLDPILESGNLPGFSRMFSSGVGSDCLSTIPPLTPPAWSTMMTGVNPGKHGIFDFLQPDSTGAFRMVDARTCRRRSFIDHARENDVRAISLLAPYTFPPDPESTGLVVSGLGTPSWESDFIRPHSFRDRLLDDFPFLRETDPTRGQSLETLHSHLLEHTNRAVDLSRRAMKEIPDWGLCFVVFQATDLIPHFYSKYFDPGHPDYPGEDSSVPGAYRDALDAIYRAIDPFLGECLDDIANDGGWVILVSDHGSQPLIGAIGKDAFLTRWLEEEGYLVTGGGVGRTGQAAKAGLGSLANRFLYLARRYTPHGIRDAVNRILGKRKEEFESKLTAVPFLEDVVWEKTRAFCAPGGYGSCVYINREGDFPHGSVAKGAEYFNLREKIRTGLSALKIAPGVPLFTQVLTREEALWGHAIDLAPDLLLLWKEDSRIREYDYRLTDGRRLDPPGKKEDTDLTWCGTHRMEGMFAIAGEGVRKGGHLEKPVTLADILPTVHLIAGMPIPSDVDGRVIESAFEEEFLKRNPPTEGPPDGIRDDGTGGALTEDDSDKLLDLLTGLGYLN